MINEKDLTKERNLYLTRRFAGTVFGRARFFRIWFDDDEIKYIETNMESHKLYRLISGQAAGHRPSSAKHRAYRIAWLRSFLDDPKLPLGIRAYIKYYIGHDYGYDKGMDEFDKTHTYEESILAEFFAQRWMETCR